MKLPIRYYGDPILRQKCKPVEAITDEIKAFIRDMIETCDPAKAIGLSACQVGVPLRIFVLRNYLISPEGRWTVTEPIIFINPEILETSEETERDTEGCVSIPKLNGWVERPRRIKIRATGLDGKPFVEEIEGINARVRMHENDHLNGVLYIDRMSPKERKALEPDLRAIKKKYSSK